MSAAVDYIPGSMNTLPNVVASAVNWIAWMVP